MPIETLIPIQVFDQERFHQVDKQITGIAFDIHNEYGRYLREPLYQRELSRRCRDTGFRIDPEMSIVVSLDDFKKIYYVDHLVNFGVIIETKTVSTLTPEHRGQTLNYLFLCGLHHGTLLNFRTERVQHEFVSTSLTFADRKRFDVSTNHWTAIETESEWLHEKMLCLLNEWGAYLDPLLYRDALAHFLGGENLVYRDVEIFSGSRVIGTQKLHLLTDDIAFSITASIHHPESVYSHQQRFLHHTKLKAIQWINLNHNKIEFRTITR